MRVSQTTSAPIYLSVNNCWIKAPPGKQAIQLWRVTHLYINHNDITSGGIMVSNYGSAIDGAISFNSLHDIDGTVAPGVVQKMAAISWQFWAGVPHISAWNSVVNAKGVMEERRTAELLSDFDDYEIDDVAGFDTDATAEDGEEVEESDHVAEQKNKARQRR